MAKTSDPEMVTRFTPWVRLQHSAVIVTFGMLLLSGLPQRWPSSAFARSIVELLGGIFVMRWLHRAAGVVFVVLVVAHLVSVLVPLLRGRMQPSMMLSLQDFRDAIETMRYYLGRVPEQPRFGRFDFRQKFEYWGMLFGSAIMVVSGLVLLFPIAVSRVVPSDLIPAAKVMHSNEALLALAIIIVWHLYGAIFNPEVFPLDTSIFTGKISKERLEREHSLEHDELFGGAVIHGTWIDGPLARLWLVCLHGAICGAVFFFWTRRLGLPSGRTRRHLLAATLLLPPLSAAIPGRLGLEFRSSVAWFDSSRVLALPLGAGLRLYHLVGVVALLAVVATLWQELWPIVVRRHRSVPAPAVLRERARGLPGWERCEVGVFDAAAIEIATDGWPWRPRALFSTGAMQGLDAEALEAALLHEHAHWQAGRWWTLHLLFVVRLLQCFNPVALWSFREYCLEVEIACDAAATRGHDRRALARALLEVYESSDRRDRSRDGLRKRVELLLGDRPQDTVVLHPLVELFAVGTMAVVLPWVV